MGFNRHVHRRKAPDPARAAAWSGRPIRLVGLAGLACALVAGAWWYRPGSTQALLLTAPGQNLLIITIDTLRADALGAYGGRAATPNLDRLARAGIRYTFAHAHAVMTLPSHATIMTGRYPFEHGVRDNSGFRLDDPAETLAEAARRHGMATGAFVGAFPLDRQFGLDQGFDVYDDVGGRELAQGELTLSERRASEVVDAARAWIEKQPGPWFAWVHVFDPHARYAPPPPFDREYANNPYAGEVAYVDHALGPLVELARRGSRRTTVVVTADHGEGLGEHRELTHGTFAYESTLHVPLIIAQVGEGIPESAAGMTDGEPATHVDVLPTVGRLIGLDIPGDLPGRPLLDGGRREPRPSYFEVMTPMLTRGWAPLRGVLSGREKYIELPIEELYDLSADPGEERNLAGSSSDRLASLSNLLREFDAGLPGDPAVESPEARARLQSLGYVAGPATRKASFDKEDDPKRLIELDRLMLEGLELHQAGRSAQAVEAYRTVIARRPDMGVAYRRLAFIQWESGAAADALATLRDALERNGPDAEIEIRLGTYLAELGSAGEAIPILERVTAAQPPSAEGMNALGIAYARAGRSAEALRAFERTLASDPRNVFALENAGTVHLQRGDAVAAREAFTRALANDPRSSRAHAGLGVAALQAGRRDEAIEHWRRAVALDGSNFDALYNLATELVNAGRMAEARPLLERFVRTAPPAFYRRDIERITGMLLRGR